MGKQGKQRNQGSAEVQRWKLAEAKAQLSKVLRGVEDQGVQRIDRRHDSFAIIPWERYEELTGQRPDFWSFLIGGDGPSLDGLDLERDRSPARDVEL